YVMTSNSAQRRTPTMGGVWVNVLMCAVERLHVAVLVLGAQARAAFVVAVPSGTAVLFCAAVLGCLALGGCSTKPASGDVGTANGVPTREGDGVTSGVEDAGASSEREPPQSTAPSNPTSEADATNPDNTDVVDSSAGSWSADPQCLSECLESGLCAFGSDTEN